MNNLRLPQPVLGGAGEHFCSPYSLGALSGQGALDSHHEHVLIDQKE